MTEILALEHLAIAAGGSTLSLSVGEGQCLAVVGPAASGKTHFLQVIAGVERPERGSVRVHGKISVASADGFTRRSKVQSLIPKAERTPKGVRINDLLYTMRLGEARYQSISDLSPGQYAACELLGPLLSDAGLLIVDGQLDMLDPWTLNSVLDLVRRLKSAGTSFVVSTNRVELLEHFDHVIVLRDRQVRFAGSIEDLKRLGPPHTVHVATERQQGVRALVSPFQVSVEATPDGYRFQAPEGQELAARLLLEGYGDIQFVVSRPSTLEEILLSLR